MILDLAGCLKKRRDNCKMEQSFNALTGKFEITCSALDCGGRSHKESVMASDDSFVTRGNYLSGGSMFKPPRTRGKR
jgi:hypothetical protein